MTDDDAPVSPVDAALHLAYSTVTNRGEPGGLDIAGELCALNAADPRSLPAIESALLTILRGHAMVEAAHLAGPDDGTPPSLWDRAVKRVQQLHDRPPAGTPDTAMGDVDDIDLTRAICHVLILQVAAIVGHEHSIWLQATSASYRVTCALDDAAMLADPTSDHAAENGQLLWLAAVDLGPHDAAADLVGAVNGLLHYVLGNQPTLLAVTGLAGSPDDGDAELHELALALTGTHSETVQALRTGPDSALLLATSIVRPLRWYDPRIPGTDPDLAGWLFAEIWGQRIWVTARRHLTDSPVSPERAAEPCLVMGTTPAGRPLELTDPGAWVRVSADSWPDSASDRPHILMSATTPGLVVGTSTCGEGVLLHSCAPYSIATARVRIPDSAPGRQTALAHHARTGGA